VGKDLGEPVGPYGIGKAELVILDFEKVLLAGARRRIESYVAYCRKETLGIFGQVAGLGFERLDKAARLLESFFELFKDGLLRRRGGDFNANDLGLSERLPQMATGLRSQLLADA
jgi:hypothetical protein